MGYYDKYAYVENLLGKKNIYQHFWGTIKQSRFSGFIRWLEMRHIQFITDFIIYIERKTENTKVFM